MDIFRWDRSDQLGLEATLAVVGAVAVGNLALQVVRAVADERISAVNELPASLAPPGVRPPITGTVVLQDPSLGQHLLHLAPYLLGTALVLVGALLLFRLAVSVRHGEPFQQANVRRLVVVAVLLLFGTPVVRLLESVDRGQVLKAAMPDAASYQISLDLPLDFMLAGLLVAFFAEIFRRGARLRADVEGLV